MFSHQQKKGDALGTGPAQNVRFCPFYSKTSFSCSWDKGRKACTSDRRASLCPKALDHTWWLRLTTWSPCRWPRDHHPLCPVRLAKSLPCPGWPVPLGTSPGEAKMPWAPPPRFFTMFARGWCHRGLPRGFGKAGPSRRATWPTQFPENCGGYTGPADSSCYMGAGKLRGHHQGVTTVSPTLLSEAGQPRRLPETGQPPLIQSLPVLDRNPLRTLLTDPAVTVAPSGLYRRTPRSLRPPRPLLTNPTVTAAPGACTGGPRPCLALGCLHQLMS